MKLKRYYMESSPSYPGSRPVENPHGLWVKINDVDPILAAAREAMELAKEQLNHDTDEQSTCSGCVVQKQLDAALALLEDVG